MERASLPVQIWNSDISTMAEIKNQPFVPPRKRRDPALISRGKEEIIRIQEEYIRSTVKSAAYESLRQGTMVPASIRIGTSGKEKLNLLQDRLGVEQKVLLNMALAYAHYEIKQSQISYQELKLKIESMISDDEAITFEMNESSLDILFECQLENAQFIYINTGINLLYSRLIT